MGEELQPCLFLDPLGTNSEGADRHQVDSPDLRGQFLKHILPRVDSLVAGSDEVVYENQGIVTAEARSRDIAPTNK
jgi:hypothetical protein